MNIAVIGIGSNINPRKNIQKALAILCSEQTILKQSKFVQTEPIGYTDQPPFLNGSALISTDMDYTTFSTYLKDIENRLKRIRTSNKNGPRTIDLDIVVWNNQIVDDDVYSRDFLKNSILEIAPELEESLT